MGQSENEGNGFQETTAEELAQQTSRGTMHGETLSDLAGTGTTEPGDELPPIPPTRRGRKPSSPANPGPARQPQTSFDDETFADGELLEHLQGLFGRIDQQDIILGETRHKRYKDANKERQKMVKAIRESVPLDGQPHKFRVGEWLITIPSPSEEKTVTRHSRQTVRIKRVPRP